LDIKFELAQSLLTIGAVFLNPNEPFTWASGIKSPIYCDNRIILSHPEIRKKVESYLASVIEKDYSEVDLIAGTSTAGIAHAALVADILNLPMVYVRSSKKDHGRQKLIEGQVSEGQRAVVIEDLISTASSALSVVNILRNAKVNVLGIASIFTYELKTGINAMANAKVKNISLLDYDTLVEVASQNNFIKESDKKKLHAFKENPESSDWLNL
jgi:orotate phosphoribosyltransferase